MSNTEAMVLRSINLPSSMDEQLRTLAFELRRPKAEVIRFFVIQGFANIERKFGTQLSKDSLRQIGDLIDETGSSLDTSGIKRDLDRMEQTIAESHAEA